MVIVIGADVHKATHTFVAVDDVGRKLGEKTVKATTGGHETAMRWARREFPGELRWGIEDCRHLSARLERDLLAAGQDVVRVPPKLMAQSRASSRERGKSDPIDAMAVARAALREPDLPVASHDESTRELKLLVDRREDLVGERTRQINRLRWHLHELDPEFDVPVKGFAISKQRRRVADWLDGRDGLVAELARDVLADIDAGSSRIDDLEKRITALVEDRYPHLLAIPGCGALTAAKIAGETANVDRFRSEACFAMNAGVAPLPVWSGNTKGRVRMSRTGNRQLNAALHRIAVTQIRLDSLGRAYYRKRLDTGDSTVEALRCLKRRLVRIVFHALHTDQHPAQTPASHPLAA
ncbi:IS110 family transposase [Agromyces larvae]|uniref:IS110 family transposase n=1 Tax=Agromyces larvae TaxID=2929802 RepID=A0ABY4BVC2_9MICO|nr:IS110 family transposase [Agromyces larvae]UOE43160.1 IS110 family transposase [Agromyces larvae]UOE43180.1 IS110 family transposase [Agromyces larvae]UOE46014.1 IS110 family transposase [Agromyces larvae]